MKASGVFLGVLFFGFVTTFISVDATALAVSSWQNGSPTVTSQAIPGANSSISCAGYSTDRYIVEFQMSSPICTNHDESLKIGYSIRSGIYRGVVGFAYSSDMHFLENVCAGVKCIYSVSMDALVTQQPASQHGWSLVVYAHASQRIHRTYTETGAIRYEFDTTSPDYEVKNDVGQYITTPTFALSENGRWVVMELRSRGLALLNLQTYDVRQISTSAVQYGYGMDPSEELAVSNDGKVAVLTGQNSGFSVVTVTPECGQPLIDTLKKLPDSVDCPTTDLGMWVSFPNFHSAEHPRLYGEGYQLEVRTHNWVEGDKRVIFLAHGTNPPHRLKLLALGDSFTSGEGEDDEQFYVIGTNEQVDNCHVSKRSYPLLVAARIGISSEESKSVACAGATIGDIAGSNTSYKGQGDRLGGPGLKLSADEITAAQEGAIETFQPGRSRQSLFIERYNPEKLLIGIGGNDAGFMGKLRVCVMPGTCEWAVGEGLRATATEIQRLAQTLGSLFGQISERYPDMSVYVAGYPEVIDPNGKCDAVTNVLLDHTERVFMQQSVAYLNQVIKYAAKKANFTYLDVEKSMHGRALCSDTSDPAMNGLKLGRDVAVISSLPKVKVISAGAFHPRPAGHALEADAILAGHPELRKDSLCSTGSSGCDVDLEPPVYWGIQQASNDRRAYVNQFATPLGGGSEGMMLDVADGTFENGSSLQIEMHSEQLILSASSVSDTGGLHETLSIPASVQPGYHTLHLLGVNREGVPIDIYQFISVGVDREATEGPVVPVTATSEKRGSSTIQSPVMKITNGIVTNTEQLVDTIRGEDAGVLGAKFISSVAAKGDMVKSLIADPLRAVDKMVKQQIFVVVLVIAAILVLLLMILWRVRQKSIRKM